MYNRYGSLMFGICLRYMRNRMDAEDIMQEGFIRIFKSIGTFQFSGSFEGWMRRIMVNTAIEFLRKKSLLYIENDVADITGISTEFNPGVSLEVKELLTLVNEMPAGYRVVLNMYAVEGYSHKEIADTLGISEGTSKSQLAKARNYLSKKLLVINNE